MTGGWSCQDAPADQRLRKWNRSKISFSTPSITAGLWFITAISATVWARSEECIKVHLSNSLSLIRPTTTQTQPLKVCSQLGCGKMKIIGWVRKTHRTKTKHLKTKRRQLHFQLRSKHDTTLRAGRNRRHTHQPQLTIFWAFYFIVGEQNMEEEEGRCSFRKGLNKQKTGKNRREI